MLAVRKRDNARMVTDSSTVPARHAFESLTPDLVMDALASVGLMGDGRQLALSSYENRVYQLHLEEGDAVVAKFYRPARWSQAQILEEHAFSAELMAAEIPVVGPLTLNGSTLHHFGGFAFSVSPSRGGRAPELDDPDVLDWIGRFLARIHTVGAAQPFVHRPALDLRSFGIDSREWLLANDQVPLDVQSAWAKVSQQALDLIAGHACLSGASVQQDAAPIRRVRLHGDCHPGNILWTPLESHASLGPGPHFVDLDDARTGPAVQDLWDDIPALSARSPERQDYPAQKPEALVERMLLASSAPGSWVLDSYAGSGTLGAVAARHGRRALLMDSSPAAHLTMRRRLGASGLLLLQGMEPKPASLMPEDPGLREGWAVGAMERERFVVRDSGWRGRQMGRRGDMTDPVKIEMAGPGTILRIWDIEGRQVDLPQGKDGKA